MNIYRGKESDLIKTGTTLKTKFVVLTWEAVVSCDF